MTNIIPFPEPYEQSLALAKRAIKEENFLDAQQILEDLYSQHVNFEISQLLVQTYVLEGEETKALILADELENDYLSSMDGIKQYFQLLILNNRFIRAHILLNSGKKHDFFKEEQSMLILFEQVFEEKNRAVFELKKKQFSLFKNQTKMVSKAKWDEWLIGLTKRQFESLVFPSLIEENSPFMISRCCELLVRLGEQRTYLILHPFTKKVQEVSFKELDLLENSDSFRELEQLLTDKYHDQPFLHEVLYAEIVGHWAVLFPFIPKKENVKNWIQVYSKDYVDEYFSENSNETKQNETIEKQKEQIRQMLQKI